MAHDFIIIQVSFPKDFDSMAICKQLIASKLAVCIHKFPAISSYYEWKNTIESSEEYLLHIKTSKKNFAPIETLILSEHPYDVPELFSITIDSISAPYLNWAKQI